MAIQRDAACMQTRGALPDGTGWEGWPQPQLRLPA